MANLYYVHKPYWDLGDMKLGGECTSKELGKLWGAPVICWRAWQRTESHQHLQLRIITPRLSDALRPLTAFDSGVPLPLRATLVSFFL